MADGNIFGMSLGQLGQWLAAQQAMNQPGLVPNANVPTDPAAAANPEFQSGGGAGGSTGTTGTYELPAMTVEGQAGSEVPLGLGSYPGRSANAEINRISGPNYNQPVSALTGTTPNIEGGTGAAVPVRRATMVPAGQQKQWYGEGEEGMPVGTGALVGSAVGRGGQVISDFSPAAPVSVGAAPATAASPATAAGGPQVMRGYPPGVVPRAQPATVGDFMNNPAQGGGPTNLGMAPGATVGDFMNAGYPGQGGGTTSLGALPGGAGAAPTAADQAKGNAISSIFSGIGSGLAKAGQTIAGVNTMPQSQSYQVPSINQVAPQLIAKRGTNRMGGGTPYGW